MTPDPRDVRIAELEAQLAARDAQLAAALERIAELEESVRKSSKNGPVLTRTQIAGAAGDELSSGQPSCQGMMVSPTLAALTASVR